MTVDLTDDYLAALEKAAAARKVAFAAAYDSAKAAARKADADAAYDAAKAAVRNAALAVAYDLEARRDD